MTLVCLFGFTSYGQSIQVPAFDSIEKLETPSINIKVYVPTKVLNKLLLTLIENCNENMIFVNNNISFYIISTRTLSDYKLIVYPVNDPSYSQVKESYGVLLINGITVYCFGELPTDIIKEVKGKRYAPSIYREEADDKMNFPSNVRVISDINTNYNHNVIYTCRARYDVFIQPCSNKQKLK